MLCAKVKRTCHIYSKPTVRGICIMKNVLELKEVQKAVAILHHPWLQHYELKTLFYIYQYWNL